MKAAEPYKECSCRGPSTIGQGGRTRQGPKLGQKCPELTIAYTDKTGQTKRRYAPNHGMWYIRYSAPRTAEGKERRPRLGPFGSAKEARDAAQETATTTRSFGWADDRKTTVGEHLNRVLEYWKTATKRRTYERAKLAVELYWNPGLGHLRLVDLTEDAILAVHAAMRQINRDEEQPSETLRRLLAARATRGTKRHSTRPMTEATIKRHHAPLLTALNTKAAKKILPVNPASGIGFNITRTKPMLWTEERVDRYRRTGRKPAKVMVWRPEHAGAFLDSVVDDRLYALWHLAVYWGPRRGEIVGLDRADVRTSVRRVTVRQSDSDGELDSTKSEAGERRILVDETTVQVLDDWFAHQMGDQLAWGTGWVDSGRAFTYENGEALRPDFVSSRFETLLAASGLPPVRFHDLRHGAATMLLAAGAELKTVSETLGHASSAFTNDVYAVVAEEMAERAAEVIAAFIPRKVTATRNP